MIGNRAQCARRATLLLASALASSPLLAQTEAAAPNDPAAAGLSDIVVTATRREESLQEVPIAISAYGNEAIQALSARTVGDLSATTPNLARTSGPTGGNDAFFFIRGIGQVDSNPANDPGVGVYIDGVYLGRLQGASLDTQDIARVEVLRGPQGTLFGRNTIGGAINISSLDPADEIGFTGRVTVGSRERFDAYGALDLPMGDTFGVRISAATRNQDGWGRNVYTGRTFGDIENLAGRIKAIWEPSDTVKLTLSADGLRSRGGTPQTILTGFNSTAGPIPGVGVTPLGVPFPPDLLADTSPNIDLSFASIEPRNDTDNFGGSATLDWEASDALNVRTILAYRRVEQFANNDFDGTGYRLYDNFFDTQSNQYSAEFQLFGEAFDDRLNWLVGVYAYKEDIDHTNGICLGTNRGNPFPGPGGPARNAGGCLRNNQAFDLAIRNYAGFAHLDFDVTDRFSVILGGRYTYERKRQAFDFFLDNSGGVTSLFGIPPLPNIPTLSPRNPNVGVPTTYRESWGEFTPKVGLNYQVAPEVLLYASYSRGFKSGGFNGRPNPGGGGRFAPITAYDPETLDAYEVGFKSDLFDNRLRLNAAAFLSNYDGIQLLVLDPASGFFNNANAGRNRITGFEVEATAKPTRELLFYFNAGYTHTDYRRIDPRANIPANSRLPVTPRWTVGTGASYSYDWDGIGNLTSRVDYTYQSSVFYGAANAPLEFQEGFGLLNVRVTWTDPSDRFSISAFGLNVANKRYFTNAQDVRSALGVAFAQVGAPAEWGLEAGVKF
jgi:iron complex outermembrane recepter protein